MCDVVNVTGAGEGMLEVTVMTSCGAVPHACKAVGNGVHCITFTPHTAEPHSVVVKFNSECVTGRLANNFSFIYYRHCMHCTRSQ